MRRSLDREEISEWAKGTQRVARRQPPCGVLGVAFTPPYTCGFFSTIKVSRGVKNIGVRHSPERVDNVQV